MAELQRKTIRVGTSGSGYARYVPIILDAVIVKQEIENNKSLVRAILRKEQVYDSNYAWSDNCTSTTQGNYQNIGKMYFDTSTIQTAEFWVQHQDNGEGSAYVSASLNTNYGSVSLSGTLNLTTIPRASKLGDIASFDIESEIPLSITKYIETWQDDLEISINETVITTKENVINGDVIKFSEDELNVIYDIMKETNSIEFNFTSSTYSINETEKKLIGSSNKNVIGNISNANPIFTNFEFVDGNELTVSLTNNNKSFIKGHSNAIISIPIKDKAIGQKGAYIKSYKAIIGDIQQSANEIEEDVVFEPINKVSSNQMIVYAIDSRGNESEKIIKYPDEFINYNDITINSIEVSREEGGISESAILEFNGTFFNETFGSTGVQNEIKGFYLYNNNSSSDSIEYTELELTIEDNKYSFSGKIKGDLDAFGFNVENEYVISIKIVDLLNKEGKTDSDLLLSGTPNMALADTGQVAFGGICDLDSEFQAQFKKAVNFENGIYENGKRLGEGINKNQLLDMVYPIGSLYISLNETNPSELFGGSWERIKDRFIYANGDTTTSGTLGGNSVHNHGLSNGFAALNVGGGGIQYYEKQVSAWGTNAAMNVASSYTSYQTKSWGIGLGGATDNGSNMPPYITAFVWKRTA